MKKLLVATIAFLGFISVFAQNENGLLYCGYNRYIEELKNQGFDPDHDLGVTHLEKFTENFDPTMAVGSYQRGSQTIYIIPIVFHIIHKGGVENISDAQVIDAVEILNRDYNKMNADTASVVATFSNNIANVGFEFRLAQKDALGNCVSGITRTFSLDTDGGGNAAVDDVNRMLNNSQTNTQAIRYPRDMYLNIWVCNDLEGAAGYTNTPSNFTPPKYDGIWIQHDYTGSIGTSMVMTSRALTHEVGHWMNLRHTWGNTNEPGCDGSQAGPPCNGDDNCTTDDNVTDTPNTIGWTTCNLLGKTCSSDPSPVDNVQNYMDYSYCSRMFTNGQKTRMIAAISSTTGQRNELWQTSNLTATGVNLAPILCAANFTSDKIVICEGDSVTFEDMTYHGATGWNWTFTGGLPASSTDQNPTITYATAGTYNVTLTATNGSTNVNVTKTAYITVIPAIGDVAPLVEGFETTTAIPNNDWFLNNPDAGQTWNVTSTAAYSGTKSIKLNSSQIGTGNLDEFISSTYDLSSLPAVLVTFKYAFAQKNANNTDILKVYVSNDCGDTWTLRKQIASDILSSSGTQSSAFTPSSQTQWEEGQVTNITPSYLTPNFRIKFSFESGGGNNLYIDDINISGPVGVEEFTYDFHLTAYPNPFESNTTVTFNLENNIDVNLELYDMIGKKVMNIAKGNLSSGQHSYTINGNELASGVYFVKMKAGNREQVMKVIVQ